MTNRTDIVPVQGVKDENKLAKNQKAEPTKVFVHEIRQRIDTYFSLVVRSVRDSIPKAIGYFLVKGIQEKLPFDLYAYINKSETTADILGEPATVTAERDSLYKTLGVLKNAQKVLQRDPDLTASVSLGDDLADLEHEIREDNRERKDAKSREAKKKDSSNSFEASKGYTQESSLNSSKEDFNKAASNGAQARQPGVTVSNKNRPENVLQNSGSKDVPVTAGPLGVGLGPLASGAGSGGKPDKQKAPLF